ncbi:VOC family protein [Methanosarcina mazei]|uniref:3-demethylubiquinone-9 3-methyltransferase n=1 Tax=Methanosarcina mazei LYC TaxID=1434114 RepID=A0A0E3RQU0_METMZ|nr:VOC family protein [Methanosarcina mazei]AKB67338.1 3-demethylubiquinone-9 3-methyltransferase [Methanosarcina mazei LYC]
MQKITPFLWFDSQAEEAVNFYISIFKNSSNYSGSLLKATIFPLFEEKLDIN